MLTNDDLIQIQKVIHAEIHAVEKRLTQQLAALEKRLIERIDQAQMDIVDVVDKHKADKEAVQHLENRVERIEHDLDLPPLPAH